MRFSIGQEQQSGRYYLSIPVANRWVDYEEYYEISKAMHDAYPQNREELLAFAEQCRKRMQDHCLLVQPGKERGHAV